MLHSTVREAQARTSSREFSEWLAVDRHEPWDDHRLIELEDGQKATRIELAIATVAQTVANFMRNVEQQREPFGLGDFIVGTGPPMTPEEFEAHMVAQAEMMTNVYGVGVIEDDIG